MDKILLEEVLECLGDERTLFYYGKDHYAMYLLERLFNQQNKLELQAIKRSQWSKLLDKPALKPLVAQCGDGLIKRKQLLDALWTVQHPYVLTLGRWAQKSDYRWAQTSRPGCNLVLQLNLSSHWEARFTQVVGQSANAFFGYNHPLSHQRGMTLAWSRLDFDFATDEVLIEEIQSDLIRRVKRMSRLAETATHAGKMQFRFWGALIEATPFKHFAKDFISTFENTWHEAMLTASIKFCIEELGISHIFYHHITTGVTMKKLHTSQPPRSLYSDLPRKFCFQQHPFAPLFLQADKRIRRNLKRLKDCHWYQLPA